jgi:hypothetical protein
MSDGKPFIDALLDWMRAHDIATTLAVVYLGAFVIATSVYLFFNGH